MGNKAHKIKSILEHTCPQCGVKLSEDWDFLRCKSCMEKNNKHTRDLYRQRKGYQLVWYKKSCPLPEGVSVVKKPRCLSQHRSVTGILLSCCKEVGHGGRHTYKHFNWTDAQALPPEKPEGEPSEPT